MADSRRSGPSTGAAAGNLSLQTCLIVAVLLLLSCLPLSTSANQTEGAPLGEGTPINCTLYHTIEEETREHEVEIHCNGTIYKEEETKDDPGSGIFFLHGSIVIFLVLVAGLMSGLTIGLVGLDLTMVEILARSGSAKEKKHAGKILPLIKRHHLLLVTLLLTNAAAMEALPIFLEKMVPNWAAVIISVTLVLFFGEIIPQAICARWGLAVGASVSWLVWGLMGLLLPISWPISKILDFVLGHKQSTLFRRDQLKEFVNFHSNDKLQNETFNEHDNEDGLTQDERLSYDEVLIIKGALDLKGKSVGDVYTHLSQTFALNFADSIDPEKMAQIKEAGKSRIPIYKDQKSNLVGFLLTKTMLFMDFSSPKPIASLELKKLPQISIFTPLYKMLNQFQTGRSHIASVVNDQGESIGIVTLEDVIEELSGEDISEEVDFMHTNKDLELLTGANKFSPEPFRPLIRHNQVPPAQNIVDRAVELDADVDSEPHHTLLGRK
eukprot:TRINITY_DN8375_c0_g1_i1.p1 TRINITY_DN8375_c0_g1~~TRINITY_DN8375_c0_g1_i1.p1  ORF type:complete len:494 (-),score=82.10 TRINITY_DN8375_c0_g1_i1:28-1509(-)